jgi:hypothetical protein
MKYAKMLGLLAVAAAALMAFAGIASATTVTSNEGETPTLKASAEGHAVLDNPIATIECASNVEGAVQSHGAGVDASGAITALSFTGCTNSWHVTVSTNGSLSVNSSNQVSSSGATVEATRFGIACRYSTGAGTAVGNLTESSTTGSNATMHIEAAIPFHSGSFLCGSGATTWTGSYKVNSPSTLNID